MNFYKRKRRMPAVIIVSLIDIFAILLIFVIVTTTFKRAQPSISIKLPESSTALPDAKAEDLKLIELSVSPEGVVKLDNHELEVGAPLVQAVRQVVADHRPIALKADTKAPFGVVVRVLDALKEAGVKGSLPAFTETIEKKRG
ncbi:MAG: biopolymer transporter ExbD [Verrucomicrobiota bacterium]